MEEILASIRRIISDEEAAGADEGVSPDESLSEDQDMADPADVEEEEEAGLSQDDLDKLFDSPEPEPEPEPEFEAEPEVEEDEGDDVLELTEELEVEDSATSAQEAFEAMEVVEDDSDVAFEAAEPDDDPLAGLDMAAAAFDEPRRPMHAIPDEDFEPLKNDEPLVSDTAGAAVHAAFDNLANTILTSNPRTLEDLVKEMLRPMLKSWLDRNLPDMVEQIVRQEIQRVTRKH